MSQNQINELALAREMQLIFNHTRGFTPVGEGLNLWKGSIEVDSPSGKITIPLEIMIPLKFPVYPPRVIVKNSAITHPNVEKNGNVLLRLTHEWKPDTHVYQVIQATRDLFDKVPPKFGDDVKATKPKASVQSIEAASSPKIRQVNTINQDITSLQEKIKEKDEELSKLQTKLVKGSDESVTKIEDLEMIMPTDKKTQERMLLQAESIALADLLSTLDEKFKDGEINPVDFVKLYRRYNKELYIIHKRIES